MIDWEIIKCFTCEATAKIRQVLPFGWKRVFHNYYCKDCVKAIIDKENEK